MLFFEILNKKFFKIEFFKGGGRKMEQSKQIIICSKKRGLIFPYISEKYFQNFTSKLDDCVKVLNKEGEEIEKQNIDFVKQKSYDYFFVGITNLNSPSSREKLIDFYINFFSKIEDQSFSLMLKPVVPFWIFEIKMHKDFSVEFILEYNLFNISIENKNICYLNHSELKEPNIYKDPQSTKRVEIKVLHDTEKSELTFYSFCQKFADVKKIIFVNPHKESSLF